MVNHIRNNVPQKRSDLILQREANVINSNEYYNNTSKLHIQETQLY